MMEILLVLLIAALAERDPELKKTLGGVLSFYRENRALFSALNAEKSAPEPPVREEEQSASVKEEELAILEAFLKNRTP